MKHVRRALYALVALTAILGLTACNGPEGGEMSVVRNGSLVLPDNTNIRDGDGGYMCPGSKSQWNGFGSDLHNYPAADSQRTYKFSDAKDADADPIENLRTRDGVKVTLSGTFYFKTAFDCTPGGIKLVQAFDQAFVNRPEGQRPWENWSGWLNSTWKPILDANARDVILGFDCKDVISSCALLAREGQEVVVEAVEDVDNQSNIQRIEEAMATGLTSQLQAKLGGKDHNEYFREVTFNMEQPLLPEVDDAIAQAQRAYAKVADVRAERLKQVEQVKVEIQKRKAAAIKAKGYAKCPSCARQDELDKLPDTLSTLVFGDGSPVAIGGGR